MSCDFELFTAKLPGKGSNTIDLFLSSLKKRVRQLYLMMTKTFICPTVEKFTKLQEQKKQNKKGVHLQLL